MRLSAGSAGRGLINTLLQGLRFAAGYCFPPAKGILS